MRTLLVLTCCLALTAALGAEEQDNNKKNKKTTQQAVTRPSGHAAGNVEHGKKFQTLNNSSQIQGKQTQMQRARAMP